MKDSGIESVLLFPGQGSQTIGMGKSFYDRYKETREIYEIASDVLHFDVAKICFEDNTLINRTEYTQPALLTTQYAIYKAFVLEGGKADVCAGLSLGEYTAVVVSGALRFEDAVGLVRKRGQLMQNAAPEGETMMSAIVGLTDEQIIEICEKVSSSLAITNYNSKGQVVIGGYKKDVLEACSLAEDAKAIKVAPLQVSVASHCFIQRGASCELDREMQNVSFYDVITPYISNVDAEIVRDKDSIKDLLVKQLYSPIKWRQTMELIYSMKPKNCYEMGSDILTKMIRRVCRMTNCISVKEAEDMDRA